MGARNCCQRSSGAEKKALDVHFKLLVAICIPIYREYKAGTPP
jgi:hypothetical protein